MIIFRFLSLIGAIAVLSFSLPAQAQQYTGPASERDARDQENLSRAKQSDSNYIRSDEYRLQLQRQNAQRIESDRSQTQPTSDEDRVHIDAENYQRARSGAPRQRYDTDEKRLQQDTVDQDRSKNAIGESATDYQRRLEQE